MPITRLQKSARHSPKLRPHAVPTGQIQRVLGHPRHGLLFPAAGRKGAGCHPLLLWRLPASNVLQYHHTESPQCGAGGGQPPPGSQKGATSHQRV